MNAPVSAPLIGHRYVPVDELGIGGMGRVYRAYDRLTGHDVALKHVLIPTHQLQFASQVSPDSDSRLALAHEFQMLASLRHPNIINVIDYGFDAEQRPYFTMTLLDDSQTIVEAGLERPTSARLQLLQQLVEALVYIHRRQILHRDLKPSNVLVQDGQVFVLDFGLAVDRNYSDAGRISGTLAYIPPEVLLGQASTEASDLYAVGLLAYEMFSGHLPYTLDVQTMIQEILYTPADVDALGLSPEISLILGRLLAKQPEDRYGSADELLQALYAATGQQTPLETIEIRESFLQAARFVGRDQELQLLTEALTDALNGTGTSWLIGGESGVGKSRLIDEIRIRALVDGMLVVRGQAITETHSPYLLWRDVIRRLLLDVEPHEEGLPLLRLLVPDIETLLERHVAPVPDIDADTQRQRMELAVENCFRSVLSQQPILLILEDVQWAQNSLPLVNRLARLTQELPLVIIASYRDDEYPALPDQLPTMQIMSLKRLDNAHIEALSRAMLGKAGERPQVIRLLQRETEGNIFFLIEVVRALSEESGRISDIGITTLPDRVFAGGIRTVLERRIERVPAWAQPTLYLAAVLGRQIDEKLLRAASPDIDIDAWITVCANAAVLDIQDEYWRFAHDKLREYVLDHLTPTESAALHRRAAEAIERVYRDRLEEYVAVLAEHWGAAGDAARESHYRVIAIEPFLDASDFHTARRFAERALTLESWRYAQNPAQTQAQIQLHMGRAAYGLGDYRSAAEWYAKALDLYRQAGDEPGIAITIASLSELDFRQGKYQQAKPLAEQALAMARALGDQKQIGNNLMNLGVIAANDGDLLEAKALFEACLDCMKAIGEPMLIARALNNLGIIHDLLGDIPEARMLHTRALAIRRRINDRHGIAYSLNNLAVLDEIEEKYEAARRQALESLALLRSIDEKMSVAAALGQVGSIAMKTGSFDDALKYTAESLALRRELGDADGIAATLNQLGQIAEAMDDEAAAWDYYRQALQTAFESGLENRTVNILISMAKLWHKAGDDARAYALLVYAQHFQQQRHVPTSDSDTLIGEVRAALPADLVRDVDASAPDLTLEQVVRRALDT